MEYDRVWARFAALAEIETQDGQDAQAHRDLCDAAVRALRSRLREETPREDDVARLELAAAADAYYGYTLMTGQGEMLEQVKLGHLAFSMGSGGMSAARWREHCFALVSDLLVAGDFAFTAV